MNHYLISSFLFTRVPFEGGSLAVVYRSQYYLYVLPQESKGFCNFHLNRFSDLAVKAFGVLEILVWVIKLKRVIFTHRFSLYVNFLTHSPTRRQMNKTIEFN